MSERETSSRTYFLGNRAYDRLKFLTQILLPAIGTLYFALAGIWGLPSAEEVVGTIVAVDTFLGVVLQLSSSGYANSEERFDGQINIEETAKVKRFSLELKGDPDEIETKDEVVFKVSKEDP